MEQKTLSDVIVLILSYLTLITEFLKAILIPVAPAAVVIAFLIDHVAKRLPFWKDGWGGYAAAGLNLLFSAGLYFANQAGQGAAYLNMLVQLGVAFTLLLSVVSGFLISSGAHTVAVKTGIGKSLTGEADEKLFDDWRNDARTSSAGNAESIPSVGDGPVA